MGTLSFFSLSLSRRKGRSTVGKKTTSVVRCRPNHRYLLSLKQFKRAPWTAEEKLERFREVKQRLNPNYSYQLTLVKEPPLAPPRRRAWI